jgi:RND family efflux transporter MFP subunit
VPVLVVSPNSFSNELLSQGVIRAVSRSEVGFESQGRIIEVLVKTGQRVNKGQIIARLNHFEIQNEIERLGRRIAQAKIALEAKLISLGYSLKDSASIPHPVLLSAQLETNLPGLEAERALANYRLDQTYIKAPISGVVEKVEAQAGNPASAYKSLCTIIDDSRLEAVFPVLESEWAYVALGQSVKITPLYQAERVYHGQISKITPKVDEHGMIQLFASVLDPDRKLVDGMHADVSVQNQLPQQLCVPKEAVVDRQGRQVVFLVKENKAFWRYVKIGLENSREYAISEGLKPGDSLIIGNNFHLSHLQEVRVVNGN